MPPLSQRIQALPASAIRKYLPMADALRAQGVTVYPLNIGQPDVKTSPLVHAALQEFQAPVLAYAQSAGYQPLREAISRYYQRLTIDLKPEETIVTIGGSEALMAAFDIVCDPGDEIIVFEPFYTNYQSMAGLKGVTIVPIPTSIEKGFALPPVKEIKKYSSSHTKAILISNPSNPTGSVIPKKDLEVLVAFAQEHEMFIVSDEVYREFVFEEERATSILEISGSEDGAIVIDSVSKRYSACGARVGWLATRNQEVLASALKIAQMRLSAPTIEQVAMTKVIEEGDEDIQRAKTEYAKRREVAMHLLSEAKIPHGEPNGALYLIADIGVDAEAFTEFMLKEYSGIQNEKETVLTTPAQAFYLTPEAGKTQVRLAFVIEEGALEKAIRHLLKGKEEFLCKM